MRSLTYFSLTKPCVRQNTQVQLAADRLAAVDKAAAMAAAALKPVVAAHARQLVHEGLQLCCMRPAVCRRRQHNGGLFRTMWPSMAGRRRSGCVRALSSAEVSRASALRAFCASTFSIVPRWLLFVVAAASRLLAVGWWRQGFARQLGGRGAKRQARQQGRRRC